MRQTFIWPFQAEIAALLCCTLLYREQLFPGREQQETMHTVFWLVDHHPALTTGPLGWKSPLAEICQTQAAPGLWNRTVLPRRKSWVGSFQKCFPAIFSGPIPICEARRQITVASGKGNLRTDSLILFDIGSMVISITPLYPSYRFCFTNRGGNYSQWDDSSLPAHLSSVHGSISCAESCARGFSFPETRQKTFLSCCSEVKVRFLKTL
ncbi:hypothetical protein BaRGS_00019391 [Batillaria attramentaria]|uniref:Uncharacterized protein n=1 Tax=Batillaria attramentaria TaxID=370345 RepID=A0ABD0KQR7_9CAEN